MSKRKPKVKVQHLLWGSLKLARERIGKDPTDCLAWIIRFSQMDLATLRPEERVALAKDLAVFPVVMGYEQADFRSDTGPIPDETLTAIHDRLGRGLRHLMEGDSAALALPAPKQVYIVRESPKGAPYTQFRTHWDTRESISDATLITVARLLLEHGQKVRACEDPDCRKVFVSNRQQTYCSPQCSQRVRNYRRKLIEKEG